MAKDSSFDIVCEIDMQEVDNAYGQAAKEVVQRYDLKGTGSKIELDKGGKTVTITAPSDFVVGQVRDIFTSKLVKRGVDLKSVSWGKVEPAAGGNARQTGSLIEGHRQGDRRQDRQGHQGPEAQVQGDDRAG